MAVLIKREGPRYQGKVRKPYTIRWTANGKQREQSFPTKRDALDFKVSVEHETRSGTYADPKLGSVKFTEYAAQVISGMDVSEGTAKVYSGALRTWLAPWAGQRTLAQVSRDREGAAKLLNETM